MSNRPFKELSDKFLEFERNILSKERRIPLKEFDSYLNLMLTRIYEQFGMTNKNLDTLKDHQNLNPSDYPWVGELRNARNAYIGLNRQYESLIDVEKAIKELLSNLVYGDIESSGDLII